VSAEFNVSIQRPLRVTFCWAEVTGYMAACWRALAARPGVDLHIVYPQQLSGTANPFLSDPLLLEGLSNERFISDAPNIDHWLRKAVAARNPDVVVLCGWLYRPYSRIVHSPELKHTCVVLGMDSPWRGSLFQRIAKFRLASLVNRVNLVVTSGERSSEYARRIGVPENRIRSGYYGFDHELFSAVARKRSTAAGEWPRQFLFVGRYAPEKDLPTLMKAYAAYRAGLSRPWGLTCCGAGVDRDLLKGVPGVVDAGFTQPKDLPSVLRMHGVFVLPSRFEPWGVALAEAAASGLPVICSTACGAGIDLVRPYYNGLVVAPTDVSGLARAMRWIHDHEAELPAMGSRSQGLAEAYSAEAWARSWHNYFLDVLEESAFDAA
jgi:glycosyltransferase involved in cell wall biosynthesis